MELKAELKQPYSTQQRCDFIVENNYRKGYEIVEKSMSIQAWGKTTEEEIQDLKTAKYNEANAGAKEFLESGNALYEFEEGKHVEAFDGNMSKMTSYLLAFESGIYAPEDTVIWVTKEDEIVHLTKEQIADILTGIGKVQAVVWSIQFPAYLKAIEEAKTIGEIVAIVIEYNDDISALNENNPSA